MAINEDFYTTVNELFKYASGGETPEVQNYDSFIDAGKLLSSVTSTDLQNKFLTALANKIQLSINTARGYTSQLADLKRGTVPAGGIIEVITYFFYSAREPHFASIDKIKTGTNQWEVFEDDEATANYYLDSDAWTMAKTIKQSELAGAFKTPEAMDSFITNTILYLYNSDELRMESATRGLLAKEIIDCCASDKVVNASYGVGVKYNLLKMYNDQFGYTSSDRLTAAEALGSTEFVRYAQAQIEYACQMASNPNKLQNLGSDLITFAPTDAQTLYLSAQFDKALNTYAYHGVFNPNSEIKGKSVSFWQTIYDSSDSLGALKVQYETTEGESTVTKTTSPVIAVMVDYYALGVYDEIKTAQASPLNARTLTYDMFLNHQVKLLQNKNAVSCVFVLEDVAEE